ncbi:MAG: redoxin family protein, partial [Candidatus Thermoplasmatota archaeon]|nr:redoxin family protein [Candidatus Thermoplasmatota archaeon]
MQSTKIIWIIFSILFLTGLFPSLAMADGISAPDFTAVDEDGVEFSLSDYTGEVVIMHINGLETPLCIECLEEMTGQLRELEKLTNSTDINIVTINLRKNPNSDSGKVIAERDYGI